MRKIAGHTILLIFIFCQSFNSFSQIQTVVHEGTVVFSPEEIDDVLLNPGKGFMTFQRFNGDSLNPSFRWTEGFPIVYQEFNGDLTNVDHPSTTIAYYRIYWKFIEPEKGIFNWALLDQALDSAVSRGQTLMIRVAPYGTGEEKDVPDWYRKMVDPNHEWKSPIPKWAVDPEDPRYAEYFGKMVRAVGARYDGHPHVEGIDLAIVGAWGEGAGSKLLSKNTMQLLIEAYTESFTKTPLIILLMGEKINKYASSLADMGWRVDCLGDLDFWAEKEYGFAHMYDLYPQRIINCGMQDAWKTAPVSIEICGTFGYWKDTQGYSKDDVEYIFNEALKWHISSFNAKSSPVPDEWEDLVDEWLKKMGYRFVLRRFSHPGSVRQNGKLSFKTWWDNKGVAPIYKDYLLAFRLVSDNKKLVCTTNANIRSWLPGDNLYDDAIFIPLDFPTGEYEIQVAILDKQKRTPAVKLAIGGGANDGWYNLGKVHVVN
jgi:uncharacterized protein DUF4832/glycosyl hydrolase family 42 (putative beta-galactosidase)